MLAHAHGLLTPITIPLTSGTVSNAYRFPWLLSSTSRGVYQSFAHEWGEDLAGRAYRALGAVLTAWTVKANKDGGTIDGSLVARRRQKQITKTAGATKLAQTKVSPLMVDFFIADLWSSEILQAICCRSTAARSVRAGRVRVLAGGRPRIARKSAS